MFSWRYVESKLMPWCKEHGVGILAHSTLGKGLLTGRYKPGHVWEPDDERSNMVRNPELSRRSAVNQEPLFLETSLQAHDAMPPPRPLTLT